MMIANYFTNEELQKWLNNNSEKLGRDIAQKFLLSYNPINTIFSLPVKIFKNPTEYEKCIKSNLLESHNLAFIDKWRYNMFSEAFIEKVTNVSVYSNIDILKVNLISKGEIIILRKPTKVYKDEKDQFHNINDGAIIWPDGYKEYYFYGVKIDPVSFLQIQNKKYSFANLANEKNEEIKSAILRCLEEKYGTEFIVNFIRKFLREVDTYIDTKNEKYLEGTTKAMNVGVYTLFKGQINQNGLILRIAYVRCYCPSTDRMFFLGVHPDNTNAKDAIASLYRIPKKLANDIKYIQRQGERFSTVFNNMGKAILETLNENDLRDFTTISGSRYFKLMRYEY